jgi:VanZ family protein
MKLTVPSRNPRVWLAGVIVWFVTLWLLSSSSSTFEKGPEIPFSDKICHFGYFLGGGGLLSAFLYCRRPAAPGWRSLGVVVVVTLALVGLLDEWHQTFTPGRSGNDPWDWLADVLGASAGLVIFKRFHHLLQASRRGDSS